jgi:hypothetical protein
MLLFVEVPGGWLCWSGDHADWLPCGETGLEMAEEITRATAEGKRFPNPRP